MNDETKKILMTVRDKMRECCIEEDRAEDVHYNCGILDAIKVFEKEVGLAPVG